MTNGPVLVVGATGLLGGLICAKSVERWPVRALVRSASKAKARALIQQGVEIAIGDLKDRATLVAACRGIQTVISTATAIVSQHPSDAIETVDLAGQMALIDAAEAAGVRKFVFISLPEQPESFPLQTAKRTVEGRLRHSRLAFTVLRPAFFQEVWLSAPLGFNISERRVRIYGTGDGKLSWISAKDVAAAASAAAVGDDASGRIVALNGPEALNPREVVKIFEEISGQQFAVEYIPVAALQAQYATAVDPREKSFFALAIEYSRGRASATEASGVVPSATISVREYAAGVIQKSNN
jgi:uncharacterized protein YbjT (DUF2867 family)